MLKPWPKKSASPVDEVGLDRLGVERPLHVVRREDHDQVGLLARLVRGEHAQPLGLGLRPALRALGQPDPDVDAAVAQGQRVGVPLAAVAEDRHVAPLDHRQVGVVVVEHLSHGGLSFSVLGSSTVCEARAVVRRRRAGPARRPA